jgi:cytochrome c
MARGAKLYKRCVSCHTLKEGERHKVGPNLWAVYGATAGEKEGFAYSKAMKASGLVWDDETLSGYIENPRKYMPGNRMTYAGLRKEEDRKALLMFLKEATTPPSGQ